MTTLVRGNRICETTATTGTDAYALDGAMMGYFTFASKCVAGDVCEYAVEAMDVHGAPTGLSEVGRGTFGSGNTLSRTKIYSGSNAANPVDWPAGIKRIALTLTAESLDDLPVSAQQAAADAVALSQAKAYAAAQAAAAQAASTPVAHAAQTSNPHGVTAQQVGLGNVANLAPDKLPVSGPQAAADTAILTQAKGYTDTLVAALPHDEIIQVGDLLRSMRNKAADPKWLPASGGVVAKATYPDLFALVGDVTYPPNTHMPTPTMTPPGAASGCATSGDGRFVAIATGAPPFVTFYEFVDGQYAALPPPLLLPPGAASGVSCDAAGIYWVVTTGAPDYITLYKRTGTTFTRLATPTGGVGAAAAGSAWAGDGNHFTVVYGAPPFMTNFMRSGDTFSAMPTPLLIDCPSGAASGAAWSHAGDYLTILQGPPPYALHYKLEGSTLTRLATPATIPTGACSQASYTADGMYLYIAHPAAPFLTIYKRNGLIWEKISNPDVMPIAASSGVSTSADGRFVLIPFGGPPFFYTYKKRANDTFARLPDQSSPPIGAATVSTLSADGKTIVLANAPPPYMDTFRGISPFNQATHFMLPDPSLSQSSASPIDSLYYIKALP